MSITELVHQIMSVRINNWPRTEVILNEIILVILYAYGYRSHGADVYKVRQYLEDIAAPITIISSVAGVARSLAYRQFIIEFDLINS